MSLRVVFMGTPDFAVPTLTEIVGHGHEIACVYTREAKPAGRGLDARLTPVHALANTLRLPVRTPRTLRADDETARFQRLEADIAVVVAYGLILPPAILAAPRRCCLNLHGSLLPRWRGAAPIHRAVMSGDTETGVMVMQMEAGLDTGPVAMTERLPIDSDMTTGVVHDRLKRLGADLMIRALAALEKDALRFTPQAQTGATYAQKITKDEARIEWSRPAAVLHDHIRGLSPFPGAWFAADWGQGPVRVKVLKKRRRGGCGWRSTGHDPRRGTDHCLRQRFHPADRGAAGRTRRHAGGGLPARRWPCARYERPVARRSGRRHRERMNAALPPDDRV